MVMPPEFAMRQVDRPVTLREIINYHAYDDAWVPDMLTGRTMDEAGRDKFDGDLLGDEPKGNFARIVANIFGRSTRSGPYAPTISPK